jgi:aldehyde dehydrogenase (NAD+)
MSSDPRSLLESQRRLFRSGKTLAYEFRRERLQSLFELVRENEARIHEALASDLGKPTFEAFTTETGFVLSEARHALKHLKGWMRPERVRSTLAIFPAKSRIEREPLGSVLVIAPWNFPFQLTVAPWVAALAAGNCAVLKPSELAPATAEVVSELVSKSFPEELVSVVLGGPETSQLLLRERFDHVFFTGSANVAREVARLAAENLTPVTLELGGTNPCIVDEDVDLPLASRRIAWGKFVNAGQTCIAPNVVLAPESRKDELVAALARNLEEFFGADPKASPDYARIVNERHFDRLVSYLEHGRVVVGGGHDRGERYIAPTVLVDAQPSSPPVVEEIFGPILPVLAYRSLDEALDFAKRSKDPLALYVFSNRPEVQERVLREVPSGGAAVNEALLHFMNPRLPFGGRGASGTGHYHGRFGFELFSHRKAVVEGSRLDLPIRYPPYRGKLAWVRKLLG